MRIRSSAARTICRAPSAPPPRASPAARIRAIVLISIDSRLEPEIVKALARRHEIDKIHTVSGRYDLCAMLSTESTQELDVVIDRIRAEGGKVALDAPLTVALSAMLLLKLLTTVAMVAGMVPIAISLSGAMVTDWTARSAAASRT